MTMSRNIDTLLDGLVADLHPVRPLRFRTGIALFCISGAATLACTGLTLGWRADVLSGQFHVLWLLANGLFAMLGLAAASTVVSMASPHVGQNQQGWKWAAVSAALLPLSAIILISSQTLPLPSEWISPNDRHCLGFGLGLGALTAAVLIVWLRRGAPASPDRAGLLIGIAAGSTGILAFAFSCPSDDLYHIGIWHSAPVFAGALLGRLLIPRLIRW